MKYMKVFNKITLKPCNIVNVLLLELLIALPAINSQYISYFEDEALFRLQAEFQRGPLDHLFKVWFPLPRHIQGWKQVSNQAQKHRDIISHDFRHIEVS